MSLRLSWPTLTWRPAPRLDQTYHADTDSHTYVVDHDGTSWCLRAWHHGKPISIDLNYSDNPDVLMQFADQHAAQQKAGGVR
ncbi:hypothetical protein [Streptomyces violascens]|uniref:Uncharacterized protein n=1 Tax=Streptomyces violascens TaxID=67381 RepID=A0ABQ3QX67_9ACTN|nr:hypothetical protein [Streptomyces violascens]GGU12941.1 hypothetical protein GCM10010289_38210 [Streptomyces violascens]GHI41871.1 hypothetical protein Sviol_62790 [Streptomyces violascens]